MGYKGRVKAVEGHSAGGTGGRGGITKSSARRCFDIGIAPVIPSPRQEILDAP
jgi:hypothetical protein